MMKLSIITTLYKSAPYIDEFYQRISKEAKKITHDYEIILVDNNYDKHFENDIIKTIDSYLIKHNPSLKEET